MNRRSRLFKGQIAVVMTLALPVLLGAIGLAADVGVLYFNWVTLQKAADSAALAGAVYLIPSGNLPATLPSPTVASGCAAWGSNAKDVACSYATYNSVPSTEVSQINVPAPNPPPSAGGAQTIQVVLKRDNIPTYFLRLVGRTSPFTVATAATAVAPSPASGTGDGLFPAGMPPSPDNLTDCLKNNSCFGTSFSLTSSYSPGNWGWLNIPDGFQGSTDPASANSGGGATQLYTNITDGCNCQINTGDWLMPKTGVNWGPTKSAVDARTGGTTQTIEQSGLTADQLSSSPRLVTVPIVDWSTSNGGSSAVQILGFAQVWIVGITKSGSDQILTVQFVKGVSRVATGGGGTDYGSYMRPTLIQ